MITVTETPEMLRDKIKSSLEIMDTDDLKKLYQVIAGIAAEKTVKFADMDWVEKDLSRERIKEEVHQYRQSQHK